MCKQISPDSPSYLIVVDVYDVEQHKSCIEVFNVIMRIHLEIITAI